MTFGISILDNKAKRQVAIAICFSFYKTKANISDSGITYYLNNLELLK